MTNKERQQKFKQLKKENGLVRVEYWIKPSFRKALDKIVKDAKK